MSWRWVPRLVGGLAATGAIAAALWGLAAWLTHRAGPAVFPVPVVAEAPPPGLERRGGDPAACREGPRAAAAANAASLQTLSWAPFRRPELGWAVYETMIAHEIGTRCAAASGGFAAALEGWQRVHGMAPTGVMDEATFNEMKRRWWARRPVTRTPGVCPDPAVESDLATADQREGYLGSEVRLLPRVLAAYRSMAARARASVPEIAEDPQLLTIFSSYRSPEHDTARCIRDQNCDGIVRAECSPHRTGRAMDIYLGSAPGYRPDSSADPNRLYMSRSVAYQWLVAHAPEYGFINYPFEPWHWEYVGR